MTDLTVAIVVHVLAVIWWIGGLAFAAAVFLPALRSGEAGDARTLFQAIESRFEPQVRIAVLLVGLSGLYMVARLGVWSWFAHAHFWWLDAMAAYWVFFMLLVFVIGPAGLVRRLMKRAGDERRAWARMHRLHLVLLAIALVIVAGAVAGSGTL